MRTVAIIGGGPAGSIAALVLARGGVRASIVEQQRFPREKVCGECISAMGMEVLERWGLIGRIRQAGAVSLTHFALHDPSGGSVRLPLPRPMLGFSRAKLDQLLLEEAASAGAVVHQPARWESIGGHLRVRDLRTNRLQAVQADCTLVADGRSALAGSKPKATGDMGIKAHFAQVNAPKDTVHLFGLRGCYAGLAPIEDGLWNLALSVPVERFRDCPDLTRLLEELVRENAALARMLEDAKAVGPLLSCALPRFGVRRRWPPTVIPIGNAAAALEPIGGEGMGLAMRSGEMAAMALVEHIARSRLISMRAVRRGYRRLWKTRRIACRLAAKIVSNGPLCRSAIRLLRTSASLSAPVLRMMGKSAGSDGVRSSAVFPSTFSLFPLKSPPNPRPAP